ncbi:MAG TPA: histidine phosphatase family protein [Steroidobacteraceae bacterium]|nr:histidine phosphatase family protein [Steroidobacteraceae bacterium]
MSTDKRRLTLVRHATADQDSSVRDFERPLSKKGWTEAEEMARRFKERSLVPDLILASSAVRTRDTAESFAKVLGVAPRLLQPDDSLYLADGEHILQLIRGVGPRVNHLMVVGHNPGISATAIALAPEAVTGDLPTCGTLTMVVNCPAWERIDRRCVRDAEKDAPAARRFFDFG